MWRTVAFLLLLIAIFSPLRSSASTFQELESNPDYTRVMKACSAENPALSLLKLQNEFIDVSAIGVKQGVLTAFELKSPLEIDSRAALRWRGTPFGLDLLDCFGNDSRGEILTRSFLAELVLGYATSQAVSWGTMTFAQAKAFSLAGKLLFTTLKSAALDIGWLREFLESQPNLLPRLKTTLKWGAISAGTSMAGAAFYCGYNKAARENENRQTTFANTVASSMDAKSESSFEISHDDNAISMLERELKNCQTPERCQKIQTSLNALMRDRGQQKLRR